MQGEDFSKKEMKIADMKKIFWKLMLKQKYDLIIHK